MWYFHMSIRNVLELKIEARAKKPHAQANCETIGGMCAGFRTTRSCSTAVYMVYIPPVLRRVLEYGGSGTTLPRV
jgi:hypothetical protein